MKYAPHGNIERPDGRVHRHARIRRVFESFFPRPRLFFVSAAAWSLIAILLWYLGGAGLGQHRPAPLPDGAAPIIGVCAFWSTPFLWFYIYYAVAVPLFAVFWRRLSPHRWQIWSMLGSALILFITYFQVQVCVAINDWYGPFYDLVQAGAGQDAPVTLGEFYGELARPSLGSRWSRSWSVC